MITRQDLNDYNFNSIERYFNYIVDSIVNGQRQQAKDLIKNLSKGQRKAAYLYLREQNDTMPIGLDNPYSEPMNMVFDSL